MMTETVETPIFPPISAPESPRHPRDLPNETADTSYRNGAARHAYTYLGAHVEGELVVFRIWAPQAIHVSILGLDNDWTLGVPMVHADLYGVWQAMLPAHRVPDGTLYKYRIVPREGDVILTPDPYGRAMERPPADATVFHRDTAFAWHDAGWMHRRAAAARAGRPQPLNIYEVRLGAWKPHREDLPLSYHELADELAPYVKQMGFTHVLLFPVTEAVVTGLYAPSARYGTPDALHTLVDILHGAGVGVLIEWSPTVTDWRPGEVRSHLLSNLHYWMEEFHLDGLRISPPDGTDTAAWRDLAHRLADEHPDVLLLTPDIYPDDTAHRSGTVAEFFHPCSDGWTRATLDFAAEDPFFRKHKHGKLLAHSHPADDARGILSMAHDAVGHPYRSFLDHMSGDYWQKFAGARLFAAWMMTHPGGKLWSMGCEIGQFSSKDQAKSMEWYLLDFDAHARLQHYFATLNQLYLSLPPLWDIDPACPAGAMTWLLNDTESGILAYRRTAADGREVIVVLNVTPVVREQYALPVPAQGQYREIFNSDNLAFGGSDVINPLPLISVAAKDPDLPMLIMRIPPLGCSLWEAVDPPRTPDPFSPGTQI